MGLTCAQGHAHGSDADREECDARFHDARGLIKMSQVDFAGPQKIPRIHDPGRAERRGALEVVVFAEEEIVPWQLEDEVETDPGKLVPGYESEDDEEVSSPDPDLGVTDPGSFPPRK